MSLSLSGMQAGELNETVERQEASRTGGKAMDVPEGWSMEDKALVRTYRFKDFSEAFAFLTRVALHAEKVDHHPEFTSVWNRVDFRLTTHDAGGVTEKDLALAAVIDELATR